MNKEELQYYKGVLNGMLSDLLSEAAAAVNGMSGAEDEHFPDPTDRASLETDRNFLLRVKDRERKLITKVKEALGRISDESYGTCEICGETITEQRLKARPVTTNCIECKTEAEEEEKQRKQA